MPRFYLFDVGVAGYLARRVILEEKGEHFGRALEHLIFMELSAYNNYEEKDLRINYWRTQSGVEVDFIINGEVAIEAKGSNSIKPADLRGLAAFKGECSPRRSILVCTEKEPRMNGDIRIVPWRLFCGNYGTGISCRNTVPAGAPHPARVKVNHHYPCCYRLGFPLHEKYQPGSSAYLSPIGKPGIVENNQYLWSVARYIERNPVKAGIVADAHEYRWSSASVHVMGNSDPLLATE